MGSLQSWGLAAFIAEHKVATASCAALALSVAAGTVVATDLGLELSARNSPTSAHGCEWPRVCFYKEKSDWDAGQPTAAYRDAGYWQTLGPRSSNAYAVYNSRRDDTALFERADGSKACVGPGIGMVGKSGGLKQIMISWDSECPNWY